MTAHCERTNAPTVCFEKVNSMVCEFNLNRKGDLVLPGIKMYDRTVATKTVWFWHRMGQGDKWRSVTSGTARGTQKQSPMHAWASHRQQVAAPHKKRASRGRGPLGLSLWGKVRFHLTPLKK